MNLNQEIFTRKGAEKKNAIINAATEDDLMRVSKETILRCIKEVGHKRYKSRDKELRIDNDKMAGNRWNAWVERVGTTKGRLWVGFYIQYSNTDTSDSEWWDAFMGYGDYRGSITYEDRYGNPHTDYYRFDRSDKAKVIRSILLTYVADKERMKAKKKEAA